MTTDSAMGHALSRRDILNFVAFCLGFFIGFQTLSFGPMKVADAFILLLLGILLFAGRLVVSPRTYLVSATVTVAYLILSLFSIDISWSIAETIRVGLSLMVLPLAVSVFASGRSDMRKSLILGLLVYFLFVLLYGALEWRHVAPPLVYFVRGHVRRLAGFYLDPNYFSLAAVIAQYLVLATSGATTRRLRMAGSLILGVAVLVSQSRTGIVAYAVVVSLNYLFFGQKSAGKTVVLVLVVAAVAALLYYLSALTTIIGRFQASTPLDDVRFQIWRNGLEAFQLNPYGYGPGTFRFATARFGETHDAHNTFVWILVNDGIVFSVALAAFFLLIFLTTRWHRLDVVAFAMLAVMCMFFSMDTFRPTYLLLGCLVASHKVGNLRRSGSQNDIGAVLHQ